MSTSPSRARGALAVPALSLLLVLSLFLPRAAAASETPLDVRLSGLYADVSPAVVSVVSYRPAMHGPESGPGHRPRITYRRLIASGIVVEEHGCVVTTGRVAQPGDSLVVHFPDGHCVPAEYLGLNPYIHVAVLQLAGEDRFPWLARAAALAEDLPEWVAAVAYGPWKGACPGTPSLALSQRRALESVHIRCADSLGVVWRLRAPFLPGNGGGALVTLDGKWIGLITGAVVEQAASMAASIAAARGPWESGVIVPAGLVMRAVEAILDRRHEPRGFLGVRTYRRDAAGCDSTGAEIGVIVSQVLPGSPAERYGIQAQDVIVRFGGDPVEDVHQLTRLVSTSRPGDRVQVDFLRNGIARHLTLSLSDRALGEEAERQRWQSLADRRAVRREIRSLEERILLLRRELERLKRPPQSTGSDPSVPAPSSTAR